MEKLYVMSTVGTPFYKIGVSTDTDQRILSVQTGCPFRVEFARIYYMNNARYFEAKLHCDLHPVCTNGEWFDFSGAGFINYVFESLDIESQIMGHSLNAPNTPTRISAFFGVSKPEHHSVRNDAAFLLGNALGEEVVNNDVLVPHNDSWMTQAQKDDAITTEEAAKKAKPQTERSMAEAFWAR